ncbi:MAG: hypothetical protein PVJ57_17395 [Phycisphaerae bacterium]
MKVSISTRSRSGAFSKDIRVQTNDPQNRSVALSCKGKALVPFTTNLRIVNFNAFNREGGPQTKTLQIKRGDGGPLALELMPIAERQMSAQLREVEPGERYELDVTLTPPLPSSSFRGTVSLKTGVTESPIETISVLGRTPPRLRANPPRLSVPAVLPDALEVPVQLMWAGSNPGKVLKVVCSDTALTGRYEERDGKPYVVVSIPADYSPTGVVAVTVMTDDTEAPNLRIPVVRQPVRGIRPAAGAGAGTPPVRGQPARQAAPRVTKPPSRVRAQPPTTQPAP